MRPQITDTVAKKAINLQSPIFTPSGARSADMGVGDLEYGLVVPIAGDGLQPVPGFRPAVYRFNTLPAYGTLQLGTGELVQPDTDYLIGPPAGSALLWQIDDWAAVPDWSPNARCAGAGDCPRLGVRHVSFVVEQVLVGGGNTTVVLLDATLPPAAAWSEIEVVEDGTTSFLPLFADVNGLAYSVTVESIAAGANLTLANGTEVGVGEVIDFGYKALAVTPPEDFQGVLEDAFCFSATNGLLPSNVSCVGMTSIAFNDLPVLLGAGPIAMNNTANYTIDLGALVSDADADVTSITIERMPTKGRLFTEDGVEIVQEFRLNELESEYYQAVSEVLNVSSFYSWASDRWHVAAMIGPREVYVYGDSDNAWSPKTKTGIGVSVDRSLVNTYSAAQNRSYPYGPFDHDAVYASHGFNEYVEVRFPNPVYPTSIEIGMPRGMGSVKSVWSESPSGQTRPTGAGGPHRRWIQLFETRPDESIQKDSAKFNQYYIYSEDVCKIAEKVDTLRVEMDTRTVEDWNEIEYMYLYGTDALPMGVLPYGAQRVVYQPFENAWGRDEIRFNAYDCAYRKYSRATEDAVVSIDVGPVRSHAGGTIRERRLVPQVRGRDAGTTIAILPERVDAEDFALTVTSLPPLTDVTYIVDGVALAASAAAMPLRLPRANSTLTLKPYNCNVNAAGAVGHLLTYEYADAAGGRRVLGEIELDVPCLPDLAEPCSPSHWRFTVGSCDAENTRLGSYTFTTGTLAAPPTLCCNALNDDGRVCPTGATLPAAFTVECDHVVLESTLSIVFVSFAAAVVLVLVAFSCFVLVFQSRFMRGNTVFLIACNLGGVLGLVTIVIYPGEWTTGKCRLMVALPSLAFTTIFTSMVLKAWRIDAIFNNKTLLAAKIGFPQIAGRFASIIGLDLILVLCFVLVNDVRQTSHYKSVDGRQISYSECTTDGVYMGYILLLYKFLLLVYGVILAVRVRKVSQDLSETKFIVYSIYSVAIVGIMGIYLYLFSDMETEAAFTAFSICILLIFTMPSCFVMTPRLMEVLCPEMDFNSSAATTNVDKFATGKDFALTTKGDVWIDKIKDGADNEQLLNMLAEQQEEIRLLKVALEQQGYKGSQIQPVSIKKIISERNSGTGGQRASRNDMSITLSSSMNTGPTVSRGSLHFEGSQLIPDDH